MNSFSRRTIRLIALSFAVLLSVTLAGASDDASAQTRKTKPRVSSTKKRTAVSVPVGTEMTIRLENEIDTKNAQDGERFTAIVLSPDRYIDSTVEGHIAKIKKSGKLKGQSELLLDFDTIRLASGQRINFAAQVVSIAGEKASKVDEEGTVKGGSKGKETAVAAGGGAALGAIIGGIAGGGKGAAIGAAVGAGVGAGGSYIRGSTKVKLEAGTDMVIRTTR